MHMGRAVWMATQTLEHAPYRTIIRDRVRNGLDADKAVGSILARDENTAIVPFRLTSRLLHIVEALGVVGPHIHLGTLDGITVDIQNATFEPARLPLAIGGNRIAHPAYGCAIDVKWPEHCVLGRPLRSAIVDGVYQHRNAQRIAEQNEFLPLVRAHLPGLGEEGDRGFPFRLG